MGASFSELRFRMNVCEQLRALKKLAELFRDKPPRLFVLYKVPGWSRCLVDPQGLAVGSAAAFQAGATGSPFRRP